MDNTNTTYAWPSPALDYQAFMRSVETYWRAYGLKMLPMEYTILPHVILVPAAWAMPASSDADRLTALRDKRDILLSQLHEVEEHIRELEDKLAGDNVSVMDR